MSYLKFKTIANTNPRGKPKVYYCAHKDDYNEYFESVCNDLFKQYDCSIWYLGNLDIDFNEYEDDLKSKEKEEEESRECKLDTNNDNGIESDSSNSAEKKEDTVQQIIDDPNANLININPNTGEINARPVPCCVRCNKSTNEAYTTGYCNECRSCDICGGEIDTSSDYFISLQRCEDCYFREQGSRRQQCSNCGYTALTSEVGTSGECPECNGFTMEYID